MHQNTNSNSRKLLGKNVILIRALVCPGHMPDEYTVQTEMDVGGVYQKRSTSISFTC